MKETGYAGRSRVRPESAHSIVTVIVISVRMFGLDCRVAAIVTL